jgi:hypothetical protein
MFQSCPGGLTVYVLARVRVEALKLHQPRMAADNKDDGVGFPARKDIGGSLSKSNKAETHAQDGHSAGSSCGAAKVLYYAGTIQDPKTSISLSSTLFSTTREYRWYCSVAQ